MELSLKYRFSTTTRLLDLSREKTITPMFVKLLQATIAPPITGKMFKGLLLSYTVAIILRVTFFRIP